MQIGMNIIKRPAKHEDNSKRNQSALLLFEIDLLFFSVIILQHIRFGPTVFQFPISEVKNSLRFALIHSLVIGGFRWGLEGFDRTPSPFDSKKFVFMENLG